MGVLDLCADEKWIVSCSKVSSRADGVSLAFFLPDYPFPSSPLLPSSRRTSSLSYACRRALADSSSPLALTSIALIAETLSFAFLPPRPRTSTPHQDTTIRVWHRQTGELYRSLAGHRGPVNAVQLLNDRIVSASGDSLMKLWDVLTGEVLRVFSGHERGLACVKLFPSGKLLASGSNDRTVRIWDATTGECLKVLEGHTDLVRSLAIDEEGGRVVSASYDRTTRVWDWRQGTELLKFKGHSSLVFDVAYSPTRIIR